MKLSVKDPSGEIVYAGDVAVFAEDVDVTPSTTFRTVKNLLAKETKKDSDLIELMEEAGGEAIGDDDTLESLAEVDGVISLIMVSRRCTAQTGAAETMQGMFRDWKHRRAFRGTIPGQNA